jgi:PadR family transcriptional regulator PadR
MPEGISSQMHRGLLEISILALINQKPSYGYEIVTRLASTPRLAVSEGTVYPILRRMKRLNWLVTYWEDSDSGPPRQYYKLSKAGAVKLESLRRDWLALVSDINAIIGLDPSEAKADSKSREASL